MVGKRERGCIGIARTHIKGGDLVGDFLALGLDNTRVVNLVVVESAVLARERSNHNLLCVGECVRECLCVCVCVCVCERVDGKLRRMKGSEP